MTIAAAIFHENVAVVFVALKKRKSFSKTLHTT